MTWLDTAGGDVSTSLGAAGPDSGSKTIKFKFPVRITEHMEVDKLKRETVRQLNQLPANESWVMVEAYIIEHNITFFGDWSATTAQEVRDGWRVVEIADLGRPALSIEEQTAADAYLKKLKQTPKELEALRAMARAILKEQVGSRLLDPQASRQARVGALLAEQALTQRLALDHQAWSRLPPELQEELKLIDGKPGLRDYGDAAKVGRQLQGLGDAARGEFLGRMDQRPLTWSQYASEIGGFIAAEEARSEDREKRSDLRDTLHGLEGCYVLYGTWKRYELTSFEWAYRAELERGLGEADPPLTIKQFEDLLTELITSFDRELQRIAEICLQRAGRVLLDMENRVDELGRLEQICANPDYRAAEKKEQEVGNIMTIDPAAVQKEAILLFQRVFADFAPLLANVDNDTRYWLLQTGDAPTLQSRLKGVINQRRDRIALCRKAFRDDPGEVYTLEDSVVKALKTRDQIDDEELAGMLLSDTVKRVKELKADVQFLKLAFGIVLGILGAAVGGWLGAAALLGDVVLGVRSVIDDLHEYAIKEGLHDLKFVTEEPSLAWLVLSIGLSTLGSGQSLKQASDAIKKVLPFARATRTAGELIAFEEGIAAMKKSGELSQITADALVSATQSERTARLALTKALLSLAMPAVAIGGGGALLPSRRALFRAAFELLSTGKSEYKFFEKAIKAKGGESLAKLTPEQVKLLKEVWKKEKDLFRRGAFHALDPDQKLTVAAYEAGIDLKSVIDDCAREGLTRDEIAGLLKQLQKDGFPIGEIPNRIAALATGTSTGKGLSERVAAYLGKGRAEKISDESAGAIEALFSRAKYQTKSGYVGTLKEGRSAAAEFDALTELLDMDDVVRVDVIPSSSVGKSPDFYVTRANGSARRVEVRAVTQAAEAARPVKGLPTAFVPVNARTAIASAIKDKLAHGQLAADVQIVVNGQVKELVKEGDIFVRLVSDATHEEAEAAIRSLAAEIAKHKELKGVTVSAMQNGRRVRYRFELPL